MPRLLALLLLPLLLTACARTTTVEGTSTEAATQRRVLLVVTNHGTLGQTGKPTGAYLPEVAHPWHVFTDAGWHVTLASPTGGAAPIDPRSMDQPDAQSAAFLERFVSDSAISFTVPLARAKAMEYDAIFFAGGHGTMWDFPTSDAVRRSAESIYADGGVVAAVCHGPAALVELRDADGAPLVRGKRVTGFTNAEEDAVELTDAMPFLLETRLRELGGTFIGANTFEANVITDGRLVTGQNPASARGTAEAVVAAVRATR